MNKLERIARLVDTTYSPSSKSGTYSLKASLHGNTLVLKYSTIVNFASENSLRPQVASAKDQAIQLIKDFMSKLKKDYKAEAGESLKTKDILGDDNIEVIQATSNSLRKVAYYRFNQTVDIV